MIEAWWRSLKHQWLFLHSLDSVTTVRRLVTFYVDEHNRVLPHSAFRGQTPNEMYFGTGDAVPADLTSRAAAARRGRVEAPDDRVMTVRLTTGPIGPCVWRRCRENRGAYVAQVDGQNRVRDQDRLPVGGPCAFKRRELARDNPECSWR
jgi:hypothetical protein